MVTELCEGGDLEQYLKVHAEDTFSRDLIPESSLHSAGPEQLHGCRASLSATCRYSVPAEHYRRLLVDVQVRIRCDG